MPRQYIQRYRVTPDTVKLAPSDRELLVQMAEADNVSRSEIIRRAVRREAARRGLLLETK